MNPDKTLNPSPEELAEWREGLKKYDRANERYLLLVFALFGIRGPYLDIGCGSGAMVRLASKLKIKARGVDQIPNLPRRLFRTHDLRDPLDLNLKFNLVTCIEVAEHIEEPFADVLVDNIVRHMDPAGVLVFTGAPPGQIGHNHVNCQPGYYWREKFHNRGLGYSEKLTQNLALLWSNSYLSMSWLPANLQVFAGGSFRL